MRWLVHLLFTLALVVGATYALFFLDFAGKNLFAHLGDVWRSPVMQQKVDLVSESISQKLSEKLVEAQQQQGITKRDRSAGLGTDRVTAADRKSLKRLLDDMAPSKN